MHFAASFVPFESRVSRARWRAGRPIDPPDSMSAPITDLLAAARTGQVEASEALARAVYDELRVLAEAYLRRERADHTLQPTALVHEAYLRLIGQSSVEWRNRAHFFGIAAQVMRRLLVDHARRTRAQRRDGGYAVTLDDGLSGTVPTGIAYDVLGVHEALERLATLDARQARLVELRYFVGLTIDETAAVLEISAATVSREWSLARAWLQRALEAQGTIRETEVAPADGVAR